MGSVRTRICQVLLIAACAAPGQARADAELRLGLETAAEYDDNVLARSDNVESDFLARLTPRLELWDRKGALQYDLRYLPTYEKFLDLSDLDGWSHDAFGSLSWQAGERTSLRLRDQYLNTNRAVLAFQQGEPIGPTGEAASVLGRRGFRQNVANAELEHQLTPVDQLTLSAQNVLSEDDPFENFTATNGDVTGVGLSWLRALSGRSRAGLLVRYTSQTFEDLLLSTSNRTEFYNASVQWVYRFDPTWSFSMSAGPAWVASDPPDRVESFPDQPLYPVIQRADGQRGPVLVDTCPQLDDGTPILAAECEVLPEGRIFPRPGAAQGFVFRDDLTQTTDLAPIGDVPESSRDGLTYFAAAALSKEWRTVTATLRYSRDASTTASAAGNVRDVVQGNLNWRATGRLRIGFLAAWEQRDQETTGVVFDRRALAPATAIVLDPSQPLGIGQARIGQSIGLVAREISQTSKYQRYSLALNVQYTLSRRTSLFVRAYWSNQKTQDDTFGSRNTKVKRLDAMVGVQFFLDPIQLPI